MNWIISTGSPGATRQGKPASVGVTQRQPGKSQPRWSYSASGALPGWQAKRISQQVLAAMFQD
jgi:hypothetical protein